MGHIFSVGTVKQQDAYGRWLVNIEIDSKSVITILHNEHFSRKMKIFRGMQLKNLVVIGKGKKCFYIALDKYMEPLVAYYYNNNNHRVFKEKIKWDLWHSRWKNDCNEGFLNKFTVEEFKNNGDYRFLSAFKLKGEDYVLPIFGYKDLCSLQGKPLFYPNTYDKKGKAPRCVYKTDAFGNLPIRYTARLRNGLSIPLCRDVFVFLHGFPSPAKWHYGVWKHMLEMAPNAVGGDKNLWKRLLQGRFPATEPNSSLFNNCKLNDSPYKATSCNEDNCLQLLLFAKIQKEIAAFCKMYLEQIVTLFESNTTIHNIKVFNRVNEGCKEIELTSINQMKTIYQQSGLSGICHNWDDEKPVIHISPVTMYLPHKQPSPPAKDINRDNLIFYGTLEEVKKC